MHDLLVIFPLQKEINRLAASYICLSPFKLDEEVKATDIHVPHRSQ
jgi:hypothetical protein